MALSVVSGHGEVFDSVDERIDLRTLSWVNVAEDGEGATDHRPLTVVETIVSASHRRQASDFSQVLLR
jgi:hypothetical protein